MAGQTNIGRLSATVSDKSRGHKHKKVQRKTAKEMVSDCIKVTRYSWPVVYAFPACIVVSSRQHSWANGRHDDWTCSLYTAANAAGSLHQIYLTFSTCYKVRTAELQLFIKIYNNPSYLLQKHNLLHPPQRPQSTLQSADVWSGHLIDSNFIITFCDTYNYLTD